MVHYQLLLLLLFSMRKCNNKNICTITSFLEDIDKRKTLKRIKIFVII